MSKEVVTDPQKLVQLELKNKGYDLNTNSVPKRVFILADDLYDEMIKRDLGEYKFPIGGKLYTFYKNESIGFNKGNMCSHAIAT